MELPKFDPRDSILFLGAGFSAGATAKTGRNIPTGNELKQILLETVGEDDQGENLDEVAEFLVQEEVNYYSDLCSNFYSVGLTEAQEKILSYEWKYIYTTNFDDVVEASKSRQLTRRLQKKRKTFTWDDRIPRKVPKGSVIHLHGYIRDVNEDDYQSRLILTKSSYHKNKYLLNGWWEQFDYALSAASNCFLIGYGLKDMLPAQKLLNAPGLHDRMHIILTRSSSKIDSRHLDNFGVRHEIGVEGFAEKLDSLVIERAQLSRESLKALRYVDYQTKVSTDPEPTIPDKEELLIYGKIDDDLVLRSKNKDDYVVWREELLQVAKESLKRTNLLFVDGKVGSGKTIFIRQLEVELRQSGFVCYRLNGGAELSSRELDFIDHEIESGQRVALSFDSYDTFLAYKDIWDRLGDKCKFVIESSSRTYEVRRNEFVERFESYKSINVDSISDRERMALYTLIESTGVRMAAWSDFDGSNRKPPNRASTELRDVILRLIEESYVSKLLSDEIQRWQANSVLQRLVLATSISSCLDVDLDKYFLEELVGSDPYGVLDTEGGVAKEFLNPNGQLIKPYSSILSRYILYSAYESAQVINMVKEILEQATRQLAEKNVNNRSDQAALQKRMVTKTVSRLVMFSSFQTLLGDRSLPLGELRRFYEGVRLYSYLEEDPLFWLQFSIFEQACGDYEKADRYLDAAYARAFRIPGFHTFQLDTNSLQLCCKLEMSSGLPGFVNPDKLFDALSTNLEMLQDSGMNRFHVLKVLDVYLDLVFSKSEKFGLDGIAVGGDTGMKVATSLINIESALLKFLEIDQAADVSDGISRLRQRLLKISNRLSTLG